MIPLDVLTDSNTGGDWHEVLVRPEAIWMLEPAKASLPYGSVVTLNLGRVLYVRQTPAEVEALCEGRTR